MVRNLFEADPDPNFRVDSDPDPDPGSHQNDAVPTPSFTHVGKSDFSHSFGTFASLQNFIFLISVRIRQNDVDLT